MSGATLLNIETALGSLGRANTAAPVILGAITLTGVEVPSTMRIGGAQALVVHKLIGGDRILQTMGADPAQIPFSGMFTGSNALGRAQAIAGMRDQGSEVGFSVAGLSYRARILDFAYDLTNKTAVIPYQVTIEVQPTIATTSSTTSSALSALVGPDVASAITNVSNTVAGIAAYAQTAVGQAQAIAGQATPIASLVGLGAPLAHAEDDLTAASALSSAGTNLVAAPSAAASLLTSLNGAGASLVTTIGQAGGNITGIQTAAPSGSLFSDAPSLQALVANAGVQAGAVQAGAYVNRSVANAALAAGQAPGAPVVHS